MSWSVPVPWSTSASIWNPCKIVIWCCTTIIGDTIVPSTSAQYSIATMIDIPSFESHGRDPLPVQIIVMSSALNPPIGYGSIYSYACMMLLLLVIFLFAPVSFCIVLVQICTVILMLWVMVVSVTLMVTSGIVGLSCAIALVCTPPEECCVSVGRWCGIWWWIFGMWCIPLAIRAWYSVFWCLMFLIRVMHCICRLVFIVTGRLLWCGNMEIFKRW